jgi:hypothetical protein
VVSFCGKSKIVSRYLTFFVQRPHLNSMSEETCDAVLCAEKEELPAAHDLPLGRNPEEQYEKSDE